MADPVPYAKDYDFTGYQAVNPTLPLPGVRVDEELNAVATALADTIVALQDVRRSDGALRNEIVTAEALDVDVRALLAGDPNPRGQWAAGTAYERNDLVAFGGATYICTVAHVSGTFATDLTSSYWLLIASPASLSASGYAEALSGNGVLTAFTLSQSFTSILELDVFVRNAATGYYEHVRAVGASPQVTLTGPSQITFVTAPGVGTNNIVVRSVSQTATAAAGAALSSATAAAASASAAAASASAASTSETNAAGSASSASSSASSATGSASSASSSASSAATSAATATTQAGNASTSAGNAATSATNAANSASSASTSASTATTQAGNASTSATNAATSAGNAATSATNAANSASSASTSASTATTQAGAASASAASAAAAAATAALTNSLIMRSFGY